ncbi:sulfatase-like hydrolase/transferase [Legionella sp. CNM-4043-24]|uniref:sulfatase-like hydrolase/transferase n=1 Tax=Legionella sp. CNM-4043-24 TaxID=3421646 RepID=UPI00403AAC6B
MTRTRSYKTQFFYFVFYNFSLLFIQLILIFLLNSTPFLSIAYPTSVYFGLLAALGIQIMLSLVLSGWQTALLWGVDYFKVNSERWHAIIFIVSLIAIISTNRYFYPLSIFSRPFEIGLPPVFNEALMLLSIGLLFLLSLLSLWRCARQKPHYVMLAGGCLILSVLFPHGTVPSSATVNPQNNLVMIGIDSLNTDRVNAQDTPNIYRFLTESVQFKDTISPLARTTPAWASLLTGLYALNHGARENLYSVHNIKTDASFAWNFKQRGYYTLFATDDRRFNNIDTDFGFDNIIGPKPGIYDMILGTFYDFPLSNFLINTPLAKWLVPYNYDNRASFFSYYPSTFDRELQSAIRQNKNKNGLFLAVHFTLPHWPYAWAPSPVAQLTYDFNQQGREQLYDQAVRGVDEQVGRLLTFLEQQGILENSMLILLSDHGEAMYTPGSRNTRAELYQGKGDGRFADYLKRKTATELDKSGGHGSDLLSPAQFKCLLGFKLFKNGRMDSSRATFNTPVALIDIAPTVADYFQFQLKEKADGLSLLTSITQHRNPVQNRMLMMESGLMPNQNLKPEQMVHYARLFYGINPVSKLIEIQDNRFAAINAMKLYGVKYNEWLLALYPDDSNYIPVLVNLDSGAWSDDPDSDFMNSSPFPVMLSQLRQFYTRDLAAYPQPKSSSSSKS